MGGGGAGEGAGLRLDTSSIALTSSTVTPRPAESPEKSTACTPGGEGQAEVDVVDAGRRVEAGNVAPGAKGGGAAGEREHAIHTHAPYVCRKWLMPAAAPAWLSNSITVLAWTLAAVTLVVTVLGDTARSCAKLKSKAAVSKLWTVPLMTLINRM